MFKWRQSHRSNQSLGKSTWRVEIYIGENRSKSLQYTIFTSLEHHFVKLCAEHINSYLLCCVPAMNWWRHQQALPVAIAHFFACRIGLTARSPWRWWEPRNFSSVIRCQSVKTFLYTMSQEPENKWNDNPIYGNAHYKAIHFVRNIFLFLSGYW